MKRRLLLAPLVLLATAQIAPPERTAPDLVIATNAQLAPVLRAAAAEYARAHPGAVIRIDPVGSDVAMARFNTNRAELAIIGRRAFDQELKAYEWIYRTPPVANPMFRGSISEPGHSPALAVRVHAANPLRGITIDQLASVFRIGAPAPTWGELGVAGPLARRPITLVMPCAESGTGRFLRNAVLADQVQFDWARVREECETGAPGTGLDRFGARIAAAAARDSAALAVGDGAPVPGTRIVAVAGKLPGQAGYPLDRQVYAYSDAKPREAAADFIVYLKSAAARPAIKAAGYRSLE